MQVHNEGSQRVFAKVMEKFKVVYTDNIYKDTSIEEQRFAEIGYDFMVAPSKDKETLKQVCRDADAVMLSFIEMDEELINSLEKCKIIVRCGMGFNNVDIAAATRKGIMVANVQKYCLDEVSDHVMALVLTLMRRTAYMSSLLKKGEWAPAKARPMYRLRGSTFGLYGLGGISSLVAKKAKSFGFNVVSYDPFLPDSYFEEMGVARIATEDELFACADVLSIHLPLNEKTAKLVNMEKFKLMKPTAIFINTARGGLVDEADMIKALQDGIIGGAGIDVFADEYPDMSNPLFQMDNVIASPHVAYYSEASDVDLRNYAINQVIGGLRDGAPEFFLNKKDLGR